MTKQELIDSMAESAGITKVAARKALESLLEDIESSLKKGNRVSLVGFGTWVVTKRAAREGRNPQTGKTIKIKAKKVVKFKPSTKLIDTDDTGPMKAD
jgi:DNA-binding protein HU-beta